MCTLCSDGSRPLALAQPHTVTLIVAIVMLWLQCVQESLFHNRFQDHSNTCLCVCLALFVSIQVVNGINMMEFVLAVCLHYMLYRLLLNVIITNSTCFPLEIKHVHFVHISLLL